MSSREQYTSTFLKFLTGFLLASWPAAVFAEQIALPIPAAVVDNLSKGTVQDLIILFDDRDVESEADRLRQRSRKNADDESILAFRRTQYRYLKQSLHSGFPLRDLELLRDYDHLPLSLYRIKNRSALDRLLDSGLIQAVYEDLPLYHHLNYSLPFIGQPAVSGAGFTGNGTTVAVIDSGINYTLPAFGSCSAPGIPAACRVVASVDVNGNDNLVTTADNHGSNVAGIAAGVAGGAKIAAFNAFPGGSATSSTVIAGIEWAIANKQLYNIAVLNMSLGDGTKNYALCGNSGTNPFVTPINNLRAAGIIPVASSGNDAYANAISKPACTPGAVSVGAVYDSSWRNSSDPAVPFSYSACTETALAAPDRIPCFSNSASILTMLAPGAFVTAAGIQMAGTSQAAPHVAGALAVLRGAYPDDTLEQAIGRLTSSGVPITDIRNGVTKPRLNLAAAISTPVNDMFGNRAILGENSGQIAAHNLNSTREAGESNHAGNPGGTSVWWSWTAPFSGTASIDTYGSAFNTLLAVYTGDTLAGLNLIAANDNDGSSGSASSVSFTAGAGIQYQIAVDGFNAAAGGIKLNWNLVRRADLGIVLSHSPAVPVAGDNLNYLLTITNYGPSEADGVVVTVQLPDGVMLVSASGGCLQAGEGVTCDLGGLANAAAAATIQIVVNAPVDGTIATVAQVSSAVSDPQASNNSATLTVTINPVAAVPALSPWGVAVAAFSLIGVSVSCGKRRSASEA